MTEKIKSFKQLKIWQEGMKIVEDVYSLTERFPKTEIHGLISQMRRAAISIPSNIAEGFKRYHPREYTQFLHISLSSAAELETQMIIANKLGYVEQSRLEENANSLKILRKMTVSLIKKLKN